MSAADGAREVIIWQSPATAPCELAASVSRSSSDVLGKEKSSVDSVAADRATCETHKTRPSDARPDLGHGLDDANGLDPIESPEGLGRAQASFAT